MDKRMPYLGDFKITKLYGTPPPAGMSYAAGKHPGVDLVGLTDKYVKAVVGGTVYRSGQDPDGWGNYIVVKQSDGCYGIYCHLSKRYKSAGQAVQAGEVLGVEGNTGMVTGQHLHFEVRQNYGDIYSTLEPCAYLGIAKKLGEAEVIEVEKNLKIKLNGKTKTVKAIEKDGYNYVKLQDLRDEKIAIEYDGVPVVRVV